MKQVRNWLAEVLRDWADQLEVLPPETYVIQSRFLPELWECSEHYRQQIARENPEFYAQLIAADAERAERAGREI